MTLGNSRWHYVALLVCLLAGSQRSFVDTAPIDSPSAESSEAEHQQPKFDEVKQLEELKNSFGKTFSVLKAHAAIISDINGDRHSHSQTNQEAREDGHLVARLSETADSDSAPGATPSTIVHTEVEVPSLGIHQAADRGQPEQSQNEGAQSAERRSSPDNNLEKFSSYTGIQYSPQDMAEYVFWTGDEKGVTLAIEEFLQEGLMTREEAIRFLQDIKLSLDYLQQHYAQQKQEEQLLAKDRATFLQRALGLDKLSDNSLPTSEPVKSLSDNEIISRQQQIATKKNNILETNKLGLESQQPGLGADEDYEELLERLKVADFLYTEYSLEEVIYQLAKVMFAQSLTKGSSEAQNALQKFTNFLEAEAEQGHISRSLEKKVLDVLIASLTDTLSEQPHLLSVAREGLGSLGNNPMLLRQLLNLSPGSANGDAVPSFMGTAAPPAHHHFNATKSS